MTLPKKKSWITPYLRMSKVQLLAIIDPEMGIEDVVRLHRRTKRSLAITIRQGIRRAERQRQKPCPRGHKPGDPACDVTCFVTLVEPLDTPLMATSSVPTAAMTHDWARDDLVPWPLSVPNERQEILKALMEVLRKQPASDYVNWEKFAQMYRGLDAQFAVPIPPRRHWWQRIPYSWGWWWRVPYGAVMKWYRWFKWGEF